MAADEPRKLLHLEIVPLKLGEANDFIVQWHRHHGPLKFHKFCIGVRDETGTLRGVAIVHRPVARMRDDGRTLEVARVATDGCPNACSALLGACWRAAKALGYTRLGTYTLEAEPGTSLHAAGWKLLYVSPGGDWKRHPRPGKATPLGPKKLWEPNDSIKAGDREAA
jgi:hypothetical protein